MNYLSCEMLEYSGLSLLRLDDEVHIVWRRVIPPHCDTRDGPVVRAAQKALDSENINFILIWVPEHSESELRGAFEKSLRARKTGKEAKEVADDRFFETAIRLHRAGEGAPYTGMKPAGLDEGPVVPKAEKVIETGDPKEAIEFIVKTVEDTLKHRIHYVTAKKKLWSKRCSCRSSLCSCVHRICCLFPSSV